MQTLKRLWALVTRKNLHRAVTFVGVAFAAFATIVTWWGLLGLSTSGKIGVTIGILSTLAAGWNRVAPKIEAAIDALPIPEGTDATANVVGVIVPAAPLPSSTPTPVTVPNPTGGQAATKDRGSAAVSTLFIAALIGLLAALALTLVPAKARAECKTVPGAALVLKCGERHTFQPAIAVGWQLNLRYLIDDGFADGTYQRIGALAGYTWSYHGERITWGGGLFGGVGLNKTQPNSPQLSAMLTLSDRWGLGIGAQRVPVPGGGHVNQALVTVATGFTLGNSASEALKNLALTCFGAVCGI